MFQWLSWEETSREILPWGDMRQSPETFLVIIIGVHREGGREVRVLLASSELRAERLSDIP